MVAKTIVFYFQRKRNSFSKSDNDRLAKLIVQFDKRGVITSSSRDAGTKERKDKVWSQVLKAFNTANENKPVDLESLKVIIYYWLLRHVN